MATGGGEDANPERGNLGGRHTRRERAQGGREDAKQERNHQRGDIRRDRKPIQMTSGGLKRVTWSGETSSENNLQTRVQAEELSPTNQQGQGPRVQIYIYIYIERERGGKAQGETRNPLE